MTFVTSKIFWVFFSPGNALLLLLVAGAFLSVAHGETRRKAGRRICFAVALVFFLIGIFPVGSWVLAPLEDRFPPQTPEHVDGIILIGGDEKPHRSELRGQPVFLDSGRRYIAFAALARKYPDAQLVFSGGSPLVVPDSSIKDHEVAKQALASIGVPVDKMLFETESRNTHENAVNSFKLVHPSPDQTWLLVTSAFHMPRALATFRKAGWPVLPATSGYVTGESFSTHLEFDFSQHLQDLAWAAHEYYGLLEYRLMGYTNSLWPS